MVRIALIVLLFLTACAPTPGPHSLQLTSEEQQLITEARYGRGFDKYQAWINACNFSQYTCGFLQVPTVVYEPMERGLLGYYNGSNTIYVNVTARGWLRKEVLMHEMVHYLQVKRGGLEVPGYAEPICRAENEAFGVVDAWLIDENKSHMISGDTWWKPYSHCWRWYDPDWDSYSWWDQWIWELEEDNDRYSTT